MRKILITVLISAGLMAPAFAEPNSAYQVMPKSEQKLTPGPGAFYNVESLLNHKNTQANVTQRVKTGQGELHADWEDHIFILEGEADLVLGGTIENPKTVSPGETRGDGVKGGKRFSLHPGDYIFVPVNTPHQMILASGKSIRYGVVKTHP
jgi:mannose-6-phosphate isomerase-like protein (cupin superfamily)